MRQLVVSISNTELQILEFALVRVGRGKLTRKAIRARRTTPAAILCTYAVSNLTALALLAQIEPLRSYKAIARGSRR